MSLMWTKVRPSNEAGKPRIGNARYTNSSQWGSTRQVYNPSPAAAAIAAPEARRKLRRVSNKTSIPGLTSRYSSVALSHVRWSAGLGQLFTQELRSKVGAVFPGKRVITEDNRPKNSTSWSGSKTGPSSSSARSSSPDAPSSNLSHTLWPLICFASMTCGIMVSLQWRNPVERQFRRRPFPIRKKICLGVVDTIQEHGLEHALESGQTPPLSLFQL